MTELSGVTFGTDTPLRLDDKDAADLLRRWRDVSDIDKRQVERIRAGFRSAEERGREISEGIRDPLNG